MGILSAFRFAFQNLFFTPILYGVIASLAVFSSVWDRGDRLKDQLTDPFRNQDDTFDFIIVGGGSAGAVLANRLSQYHTVLLLEAGGETHPFQAIPGLALFIPKNPGTDWSHKSVTQSTSCFACRNKKYILSQGRNLGGSGNINYMMHMRGNPLDFNNWATITGDPTWSYDGVLPYFIQSEHFDGETSDKTAHGYGGPLHIQIPDCIGLANEWNLAGEEMGYPHIDLNGRHSEGFDTVFYPIKQGVRQATYRAYIQPARNRRSLLIRKFAHVNKILIREATFEAYGVEYDRHGQRKHAIANKEVIVSAGTLQTPKLLVLSGVGQLEHLNALHIPVKAVLPVGKNLQDHFSVLLGPFYINQPRTISFDRDVDKQSFVKFATSGKGPLSTTGFQATAVLTSSLAQAQGQGGWPDLQLTMFGLTPHRMFYSDIGHAFGIRQDILQRYYGDADGKENAFFIMVSLARPLSKGDYCLPKNDPYKEPVIDPNFLSDPLGQDLKVMIEGIHRALYLAENTTIFRSLDTVFSPKCFPGCEKVPFRSDAYWECYVRSYSIAMNDHVGTCPMGKAGSPYAVVDPELQVQGLKGLRVVDASVMPTIVGAPTQAATIMIAEKASTLILDKWKHDVKTFYGTPGWKPGAPISQYGPPGKAPGSPVQQYGPPGKIPGSPVQQYGPPGKIPGSPVQQYGPPGKIPGSPVQQYGPPGKIPGRPSGPNTQRGPSRVTPIPVVFGDGFSNYDSFSVIRNQLNPTPGGFGSQPTPTPLIPLPPDPDVWTVVSPFPSFGTPTPEVPLLDGVNSNSAPQLSPEPSQLLIPPEDLPSAPGPTFSTSYVTSNVDFTGPIISTTPDYAASFNFDNSRSATDNGQLDTQIVEGNATSSRQGKSFGTPENSPLDGNLLGQGEDDELLIHSTTPTPIPSYFTTVAPTPATLSDHTDAEAEVINQGPGFRVVRKKFRTTPRVSVHPRGHLGHQNVLRKERQKFNESVESVLLTTSSVRPVPKDIVKIRRRRPVSLYRRTTSTTLAPSQALPEDGFQSEATIYEETSQLPSTTLPPELRSPGRKRFVRRMYARPINFRGKTIRIERNSEYGAGTHEQSNGGVTASSNLIGARATTNSPELEEDEEQEFDDENEERDDDDDFDLEVTTEYPLDSDNEDSQISGQVEPVTASPVVVFRNIELEDTEELSRQARSHRINSTTGNRKRDYFAYKVDGEEEGENPIMLLDLNPVPEIIAPKAIMNAPEDEEAHETIAVPVNGDEKVENDDDKAESEDNNEELPSTSVTKDEKNGNQSSSLNLNTVSQADANLKEKNQTNNSSVKYSVVVSSSSSSINSSKSSSKHARDRLQIRKSTQSTTTTVAPNTYEDDYVGDDDGSGRDDDDEIVAAASTSLHSSLSSSPSTTLNPRHTFRVRNKLVRSHS